MKAGRVVAGLAAGVAAAALCACTPSAPTAGAVPGLYLPLASNTAQIDTDTARDMISAYRRNKGMGPLAVDPALQKLAETEAASMAAADRPSRAQTVEVRRDAPRATRQSSTPTSRPATTPWRKRSPAGSGKPAPRCDDARPPKAARMGIATAYAPGSKYKVYWALLTAK